MIASRPTCATLKVDVSEHSELSSRLEDWLLQRFSLHCPRVAWRRTRSCVLRRCSAGRTAAAPSTSATRWRVALRRCSGRDPCRDRVRMAWSSPGDNAAVNVTSEAAHGAADCREPPTSTASRHMIELTSTRWDRLPNPSRMCEVRCKSNFRRPPLSGNSSEGGRSVTSKVVAILLTFTDGTLHSLTEIASSTGIPTRQCTDWCPNLSRGASWSAPTMPSTESAWHCARSARRRMPYPSCANPPTARWKIRARRQ